MVSLHNYTSNSSWITTEVLGSDITTGSKNLQDDISDRLLEKEKLLGSYGGARTKQESNLEGIGGDVTHMGSKVKVVGREEVQMIVVPCPRCGSWYTDPMDKKHQWWACGHMSCQFPFALKKHHALIFLKNGEVIQVDKEHPCKVK